MQGPQIPKYTIPTAEIGGVFYPEKKWVGMQFVDPSGEQIFVSFDGVLLPVLAQSLRDLIALHPEVIDWKAAPIPGLH